MLLMTGCIAQAQANENVTEEVMRVILPTPTPSPTPSAIPTSTPAQSASTDSHKSPSSDSPPSSPRRCDADNPPAREVGKCLAAKQGWHTGQQWKDLDYLWTRESGWRTNTPDAPWTKQGQCWGIPQACPGKKMASHGKDWKTSAHTQIEWGLAYITKRYGSPSKAAAHSRRKGWY